MLILLAGHISNNRDSSGAAVKIGFFNWRQNSPPPPPSNVARQLIPYQLRSHRVFHRPVVLNDSPWAPSSRGKPLGTLAVARPLGIWSCRCMRWTLAWVTSRNRPLLSMVIYYHGMLINGPALYACWTDDGDHRRLAVWRHARSSIAGDKALSDDEKHGRRPGPAPGGKTPRSSERMMRHHYWKYFHWGAIAGLITLIVWCLWETVVAPLQPGGSWVVLKAAPVRPLCSVIERDVYTQWSSMVILLYFTRAWCAATATRIRLRHDGLGARHRLHLLLLRRAVSAPV